MPIEFVPIDCCAIVVTHLLYLHGFRSSPHSFKARMLAAWLAAHRPDVTWWCPQLPASPREAIELAKRGTADWPRDGQAVLGSSLGGFYATVLAERWGCPAVVMNPAVDPARDLAAYIGEWGRALGFQSDLATSSRALPLRALAR